MDVSVKDAKTTLPQLLRAIENGQTVTICRSGKPVADLVPTSRGAPKLGGCAHMLPPDIETVGPVPPTDLSEWGEDRGCSSAPTS